MTNLPDTLSLLKNEPAVARLIDKQSDFYADYMYSDDLVRCVFDAYAEITGQVGQIAAGVKNNTALPTAELYRQIPSSVLYLSSGLYDVAEVAASFNGVWLSSSTPIMDKVLYLKSLGYYEELDHPDYSGYPVVQITLCRDLIGNLGFYREFEDYVLLDGRFYLFGELARPALSGQTRTVYARNLSLGRTKLEDRWGILMSAVEQDVFYRHEYRDLLAALTAYQPNLARLRDAITTVTFSKDSFLQDRYSKKNVSEEFLHDTQAIRLGPFDFTYNIPAMMVAALVYVPDELRSTSEMSNRADAIFKFIQVLRPSHTNFFIRGMMDHLSLYPTIVDRAGYIVGTQPQDVVWWRPFGDTAPMYDKITYDSDYYLDEDYAGYFENTVLDRVLMTKDFMVKAHEKVFLTTLPKLYDEITYDLDEYQYEGVADRFTVIRGYCFQDKKVFLDVATGMSKVKSLMSTAFKVEKLFEDIVFGAVTTQDVKYEQAEYETDTYSGGGIVDRYEVSQHQMVQVVEEVSSDDAVALYSQAVLSDEVADVVDTATITKASVFVSVVPFSNAMSFQMTEYEVDAVYGAAYFENNKYDDIPLGS